MILDFYLYGLLDKLTALLDLLEIEYTITPGAGAIEYKTIEFTPNQAQKSVIDQYLKLIFSEV